MTNRFVRVALVGCDTYVVAMVRSVRGAAHVTVVSPTCIGSADALAQAHEVIVDVGVVDQCGLEAYQTVRSAAPQASLILYVRIVPRRLRRPLHPSWGTTAFGSGCSLQFPRCRGHCGQFVGKSIGPYIGLASRMSSPGDRPTHPRSPC
jgi:hypothetical protein